jgi:hypothetical protein
MDADSIASHFASRCRHASFEPYVLALARRGITSFGQLIGLTRTKLFDGAPLNPGRARFEYELGLLGLGFRGVLANQAAKISQPDGRPPRASAGR